MRKVWILAVVSAGAWYASAQAEAAPLDVMQADLSARQSRPADAPTVERGRADDSQLVHGRYGYHRGPYYGGYYRGPIVRNYGYYGGGYGYGGYPRYYGGYSGYCGPNVYYGGGHGRVIYGW